MQPKPYILLVDDDTTALFLARRALSGLEFDGEFLEAHDGIDACDHIKLHGTPLLILLDLSMPRMDGHEFLKVLSGGELGGPPPVYVVTSSCRPEDQRLEVDFAFVSCCIEKPISKLQVPQIASTLKALPEYGSGDFHANNT
ncbi:MAG: response regulator [Granulosicoccus sp.]